MALTIKRGEKPRGAMVCDRRLCLTADKATVVEAGDVRSAYLFATAGDEIPASEAERLGLRVVDGRIVLPGATPAPVAKDDAEDAGEGEEEGAEDETDEDVDEVPEWHLKTPPEEYLEQYPDSPNADLARQILAARDESGSGDS